MYYYKIGINDFTNHKYYSKIRKVLLTTPVSQFKIAPNPAKNNINITGSNLRQIRIIDNVGKVVQLKQISNTNHVSISVNHLPKGLYMVQATYNDGSVKTEKVVIE